MPDGTTTPCGGCGAAKKRRKQWDADQRHAEAERRRAELEAQALDRAMEIVNCELCDDEGRRNGGVVCDHVDRRHQPAREAVMATLRGAPTDTESDAHA